MHAPNLSFIFALASRCNCLIIIMIDPTYAPHVYTRRRTWRRWRERERENERMRENERERERKETFKRIQAGRKSKAITKRSNPCIRDLRLVYRM